MDHDYELSFAQKQKKSCQKKEMDSVYQNVAGERVLNELLLERIFVTGDTVVTTGIRKNAYS